MLPNRSTNAWTRPGLSSNGWARMLASLAEPSFAVVGAVTPVSKSRRSAILLPGLSRSSKAAPPTSMATPANTTTAINTGPNAQSSNITRSRKALDGRRTPAASSRDMNTGRMPVAMNFP